MQDKFTDWLLAHIIITAVVTLHFLNLLSHGVSAFSTNRPDAPAEIS